MAYVWSKDLETGNAMIDSQHKELIEAINALLAACATGKGRAEVAKTTKFLYDYTCLLYTSPSPRDRQKSRMPSSA